MFVQIREGDQIDAFCKKLNTRHCTLLIKSNRNNYNKGQLGNDSDDSVEDYPYDYIYWNDASLDRVSEDFFTFMLNMLQKEGVSVHEKN